MIRLPKIDLPPDAAAALIELQRQVDEQPTYADRIEEGKPLYELRRKNKVFRPVVRTLSDMCAGARRCHYCEDSAATDIDHFMPKDYYPNLVFAWSNYLLACARCNRSKSHRWEIYARATGKRLSIPQLFAKLGLPPEDGDAVLINPRFEDPLEYLGLDLRDTFFFLPRAQRGTQEWERARHTIDLLKLNEEDILPQARSEAYHNYLARLEKYVARKAKHAAPESLASIVESLRKMGHPTVWQEMKRQHSRIKELTELFAAVPEALDW
jgi:uncharacterized protein (TIGR02646 family)